MKDGLDILAQLGGVRPSLIQEALVDYPKKRSFPKTGLLIAACLAGLLMAGAAGNHAAINQKAESLGIIEAYQLVDSALHYTEKYLEDLDVELTEENAQELATQFADQYIPYCAQGSFFDLQIRDTTYATYIELLENEPVYDHNQDGYRDDWDEGAGYLGTTVMQMRTNEETGALELKVIDRGWFREIYYEAGKGYKPLFCYYEQQRSVSFIYEDGAWKMNDTVTSDRDFYEHFYLAESPNYPSKLVEDRLTSYYDTYDEALEALLSLDPEDASPYPMWGHWWETFGIEGTLIDRVKGYLE